MTLLEEIQTARLKIQTDSYPMSIGELVSLYEDNELDINPEFQRVFRWTDTQKSNLIESIFLGIPLPSFFVAQQKNGVWDLVDGLQRISTILAFMGKLKPLADEENKVPFKTMGTSHLPSLKDKNWGNIGPELQRLFKREKIDLKIIKSESEANAKFELFQRLNTGGSKLSDQEVRNCLLLMINKEAFTFVKNLSENNDFVETLPITDQKSQQAQYQEYVIRYFIQQYPNPELRQQDKDIGPYFNEETIKLFDPKNKNFDYIAEQEIFNSTFKQINIALNDSAFKKFNTIENKYKGPVSVPIFEALATAVALFIRKYSNPPAVAQIKEVSMDLANKIDDTIPKNTRPIIKMNHTLEIANKLFEK